MPSPRLWIDLKSTMFSLAWVVQVLTSAAFGQTSPQSNVTSEVRSKPIDPGQSVELMQVEPGFAVSLVCSEPLVVDPVDGAFDDRGRLWVVEMRDYPFPIQAAPSGRVRILSDSDGDGRYDRSDIFADNLDMPTGIALWKDGAVITLAGQVTWFRDTNGDLRADQSQVWLEGFTKENEQLRANHPKLGPDGWWYIATGLRGGNVSLGKELQSDQSSTDALLTLGSRDVRFHLSSRQIEAVTGPAQFGLTFDSTGNRYFCSNRNPAVQVRLEQMDLVGNPLSGLVPSVADVIPAGEASRVYPLVNAWTTSNLHAGQFTAACGLTRHPFPPSDAQPAAIDPASRPETQSLFVCEPTGSLVHASRFTGTIETSTRDSNNKESEFLASKDAWFRPVNLFSCPDDSLAVVDMYRAVIEHPAWVPDELKNRPDERWGNDCGRIYSVRKNRQDVDSLLRVLSELQSRPLSERTSVELADLMLDHRYWMRDTAARLLFEREAIQIVPMLEGLASQATFNEAVRIESLYLAARLLKSLPSASFRILSDPTSSDSLRIAAIKTLQWTGDSVSPATDWETPENVQILESTLRKASEAVFRECTRVIARVSESSKKKLHIACLDRLGASDLASLSPETIVLAGSAFRDTPQDLYRCLLALAAKKMEGSPEEKRWFADATGRLANGLLDEHKDWNAAQVTDALGIRDVVTLLSAGPLAKTVAATILIEVTRRFPIDTIVDTSGSQQLLSHVSRICLDESASLELRSRCAVLLSRSVRPEDRKVLVELAKRAGPFQPQAIRAWATTDDVDCDSYLMNLILGNSPKLFQTTMELVLQKPARIQALARMLEQEQIDAKCIGADNLKKLSGRGTPATQTVFSKALEGLVNSNRAAVIQQYTPCLTMTSEPRRGKELFGKHCASCHRIGDVGVQVGPDISDSRTQQPQQLLVNILDPNRVIDNNYYRYVALTLDDQVIDGIVVEETSDTVVLKSQNNTRHVLQRNQLQELKATGISMMPEGIEAQLDAQSMADLIAFIKGWRYLDGSIPAQ